LNGLERLLGSYATEIYRIERDTNLAETQLHDYQSRLGQNNTHENYLSELTSLRNARKQSLSDGAFIKLDAPSTNDLFAYIKTLMTNNASQVTPNRPDVRTATSPKNPSSQESAAVWSPLTATPILPKIQTCQPRRNARHRPYQATLNHPPRRSRSGLTETSIERPSHPNFLDSAGLNGV
jgi:hypothetical protein